MLPNLTKDISKWTLEQDWLRPWAARGYGICFITHGAKGPGIKHGTGDWIPMEDDKLFAYFCIYARTCFTWDTTNTSKDLSQVKYGVIEQETHLKFNKSNDPWSNVNQPNIDRSIDRRSTNLTNTNQVGLQNVMPFGVWPYSLYEYIGSTMHV